MLPIKTRYNERKFVIAQTELSSVISILDAVAKGTSPYPEGIIESAYYDTLSMRSLEQCMDGAARKAKFRLRRYGDAKHGQLQVKSRNHFGVGKIKCSLPTWEIHPSWDAACGTADGPGLAEVVTLSRTLPPMQPVLNVRYHRRRYRFAGWRMTLDTAIEGFPYRGLRGVRRSHARLRQSVLEIKTASPSLFLPPLLQRKVRFGSFSKFAFLICALRGDNSL